MPPKIIKLTKREGIPSVIKKIKNLQEDEVVFELGAGHPLLSNSNNLKLMKRAGEVAGKDIKVKVPDDDEMAKILAHKAGVLYGDVEVHLPKPIRQTVKVARSDVKPNFSDIKGAKPASRKIVPTEKFSMPISIPAISMPSLDKFVPAISLKKPSANSKRYFIAGLAAVVVVILALAIILPQANVKVFARSEPITRDFEINVDKNAPTTNEDSLTIPAITLNQEISTTESFNATGSRSDGTKATGSVNVTNNSGFTLTLRAATTTLVADGKRFRLTRDITGLGKTGGPYPIIAESGGEAYNLPANTRFQIINSALGSQDVFAVNPAALTGGSAGQSTTVVSQEDLDRAGEKLIEAILAEAASNLTDEEGVAVIVIPSGVKTEVLTKTANKNAGDVSATFSMTMIAKVTGIAFRQSDVTDVVLAKINEVLSGDKYLLTDEGQTKYTASFKTVDLEKGTGVLAVHFETVAAYKIDESNLGKILAGKNESEIKEILLSKPEVDSVEVEFWPSWLVHKAPRFNGKIYIESDLKPKQ